MPHFSIPNLGAFALPVAQTDIVKAYDMAQAQTSQEYQATVNSGLALENSDQNQDDAGPAQSMAAAANVQAAPTTTTISVAPGLGLAYSDPGFETRLLEHEERTRTDLEHRRSMRVKRARKVKKAKLRLLLVSKRYLREAKRDLRKNRHNYQRRIQQIGWCKLRKIPGAQAEAEDAVEDDTEDEDEDDVEDEGYQIIPSTD
ncbi:hypothetical protein PG993_007454 [Apiospora rasikravindrae]|uniref:Uncharacterized protein n=1 Tax=Apiospora rasikravindrae TaxID=990691 RepID=A0ABR1SXK5_9PEZI